MSNSSQEHQSRTHSATAIRERIRSRRGVATQPAKGSSIPVRCLGLRDRGYAERMGWMRQFLTVLQEREYRYDDYSAFSQADECFDLVIVHGLDPRRLCRLATQFKDRLPSKMVVALLPSTNEATSSMLLRTGFDEVLNLQMPQAEAQARLCALDRRRRTRNADSGKEVTQDLVDQKIADIADVRQLNAKDRKVLALLIKKSWRTTYYWQLADLLDKSLDGEYRRPIHVRMCRIRQALRAPESLVTVRGDGYLLAI